MLNSKWQLWVHTSTQTAVFVGPTPQGLVIRHPVTKQWVDAVLAYRTGRQKEEPIRVWSYADFAQEHTFVRSIEDQDFADTKEGEANASG